MSGITRKSGVQVQAVARAVKIIECFREEKELGISEIAVLTGLNKSTTFGLVNTLTCYGYLEQVGSNKKYRLGITLLEMGMLVHSRLGGYTMAHDLCAPLAEKYPAVIHIAIPDDGEVFYVDKIDRISFIIGASGIGRRLPMYCTGVGKAMLAFLPEEYLKKYLPVTLKQYTRNTITSREVLAAELEQVRRTGIAMDHEEIELGLNCIAAPILRENGQPEMAISLSFSNDRLRELNLEEVKRDLLACTSELSARLGYRG